MLPPGPLGDVRPSGTPSFPAAVRLISPYESRSSGYPGPHVPCRSLPKWLCLGVAPSPSRLTGKPSVTYVVGPFIVELFAVGCFARSPGVSSPVRLVAKVAAPDASTVEGTLTQGESPAAPVTGFGIPCLTRFVRERPETSTRMSTGSGVSASPFFSDEKYRMDQVIGSNVGITPVWGRVSHTKRVSTDRDYSDEPPSHWASTSRCTQR